MSKQKKFSFEIDVTDHECSRYEPRYSNYGWIQCEGDTLQELLDTASVDIIDQDGGELDVVPADAEWMQQKIFDKFFAEAELPTTQELRAQVMDIGSALNKVLARK